ncbi:MAG: DUF2325 domain-containing protein [Ethanoligenens sp.]|uniref:DUF2325 domain-containing protein n=1 Tax=Ethanoligenens sp. TaxID=2099655 RepID=UPI0039ED95AE
MSLIIVGGHDCMCCRYQQMCKKRGHKVKVFTQMPTGLARHIGSADGIILFTSTVSHKMVETAVKEAKRKNIRVMRSHSSSATSLNGLLDEIDTLEQTQAEISAYGATT